MAVKRTFQVFSKSIIENDKNGKRLHTTKWGRPRTWDRKELPLDNLKMAIRWARASMKKTHTGYVIYRRVVINGIPTEKIEPLFQAKWGHDDLPFTALKPLGIQWVKGITSKSNGW